MLDLIIAETTSTFKNNPFPGLRPFSYEESHLYFGREEQVNDVVDKLVKNRFVGVIGTSGIGKSSFMYCGIFPVLYGDYKTDYASQWEIYNCRPGVSPIKNLAIALSENPAFNPTLEEDKEILKNIETTLLQESSLGLVEAIKSRYQRNPKNYLIFVDQFEELFRFKNIDSGTIEESAAFVKLLLAAIEQSEIPIYVVITMRADFLGDCSQYPNLTKIINTSQFLIPQMTRNEKRKAIMGPVQVMQGTMSERLVQRLLNDVGDNTDQLPIMQHALMRTWDYWQKHSASHETMDIAHYEAIGGMSRALSIHANEAYNELSDDQKFICEKIFKTITERSSEGRSVRRPTKLKEIAVIANTSIAEVEKVVDHFRSPGRTLLMPSQDVILTEDSIIDLSHESLMRIWSTLNKWVEEEAESVKLYLRIAEAAELHQLGKASLLRPPDLQIALSWYEEQKPSFAWGVRYHPAYERTILFLDFSKKQFEKEQIIKEKLQKRRLMAARATALVLGIGALIAILFLLYAEEQRREAEIQRLEADKQRIETGKQKERAEQQAKIAFLESERAKASELKALNAVDRAEREAKNAEEAARRAEESARIALENERIALEQTEIANSALGEAARQQKNAYKLRLLSIARSMAIKSVQLTDSMQKAVVAQQAYIFNRDNDGKLYDPDIYDGVYYALKNMQPETYNILVGHRENVRAIASHNSENYIYSAGSDGKILYWNFRSRTFTKMDSIPRAVHRTLAVSPDNRFLACGGDYPYVYLYNCIRPQDKPIVIKTKVREIWHLAFTPTGDGIIMMGADKKVLYWNFDQLQEITQSDAKVNALSINPKENLIALGKAGGQITIVDRNKNNQETTLFDDPQKNDIVSVTYSKDGRYLAAGNEKGIVRVWDTKTGNLIATLLGHKARVNYIAFNKDNKQMATASFDKTVRIWNMQNYDDQPIVLKDHYDWVWSIEFTSDSQNILAGCKDGMIRIWPTKIETMSNEVDKKANRNMTGREWKHFVADDIPYERTFLKFPSDEAKEDKLK